MKATHRLIGILLSCLFTAPVLSQDEDSQTLEDERYNDWYQIELIVFERTREYASSAQEEWPKNVSLEYPQKLDHLFTQEGWETHLAAQQQANEELLNNNESINNIELNNEPDSESPQIELENSTNLDIPVEIDEQANETSIEAEPLDIAQTQLPEMELPRILLASSEHQLSSESNKLARRSAYRVLFHEAWRQELLNSEESVAIPLFGGELFDQHHELEGWIKVSLNRFLHFETNLWRVNYELNYGQNSTTTEPYAEYWPEVPAFPQPEIIKPEIEEQAPLQAGIGFDKYLSEESSLFSIENVDLNSNGVLSNYETIEKSPYLVKKIITISQKRRMRSEELHYLDHPKLGVLIKVTPYKVLLDSEPKSEN